MELIIKEKIEQEIHKNEYKIVINYISGEDEEFAEEEIFVKENNPELNRFLKCLEACTMVFNVGMCDGDTYINVPDYRRFFCDIYEENDEIIEENIISCYHPD